MFGRLRSELLEQYCSSSCSSIEQRVCVPFSTLNDPADLEQGQNLECLGRSISFCLHSLGPCTRALFLYILQPRNLQNSCEADRKAQSNVMSHNTTLLTAHMYQRP